VEHGAGEAHSGEAGPRVDDLVVAFEVFGQHVEQRGKWFGDLQVERVRVRLVDTRV